ncbi:hypothetical protein HBI56_029750 [Parastagonospora nodorum]|nr:hypothetical protein HBH56_017360 [Parastagonospora nodorum]KAH3937420.1 hypothetical protein HBH54_017120 [Parastagonospora nodorum]KAH3953464.1 hypothetical protein HBH53_029490 [Parastagonospora nodorum]KAH3962719.1 hypothetical protein HBH51_172500 [Parastagonospora nodorum]KAH3990491.1 hypothetical protein HBH52_006480 [Parastagonospora nodorum]
MGIDAHDVQTLFLRSLLSVTTRDLAHTRLEAKTSAQAPSSLIIHHPILLVTHFYSQDGEAEAYKMQDMQWKLDLIILL